MLTNRPSKPRLAALTRLRLWMPALAAVVATPLLVGAQSSAARSPVGQSAAAISSSPRAKKRPSIPAHWTVADGQKRVCVHIGDSQVSELSTFATLVHRRAVDCALVYTDGANWAAWADPWFLADPNPDTNWAAWVRGGPANDPRQLVISQPLIPAGIAKTNWRALGAKGAYTAYARQFAANLVAAGVGNAIIRLSWEANGTWNPDSIGSSRRDFANWVTFWRKTVSAMRSVPGAHFLFDWCVNNGYRTIPFNLYYPGDDVVDIIGNDPFDPMAVPKAARWNTVYGQQGGLDTLIKFAKAHRKPLSIPEWGVAAWTPAEAKTADDPAYVNGIARTVRNNNVAYQSYFFSRQAASELRVAKRSLSAYRMHFGDGGDSNGIDDGTDAVGLR
jgi:hypothetical protein